MCASKMRLYYREKERAQELAFLGSLFTLINDERRP
jgi:hypothetical protein